MPNIKGSTQARGLERRRQLTESAVELFAQEGYWKTGIAAVAGKVGVSPAALLHHFKTKEGLLRAVLEQRDEWERDTWEAVLAPGGLATIRGLTWMAESWKRDPHLSRLYTVLLAENLSEQAPMREWFLGRTRFMRAGLQQAIETGQARGEIRADVKARLVAIEITSFLDGLGAAWLLDPTRTPVAAVLEDFCSRLADALARPVD